MKLSAKYETKLQDLQKQANRFQKETLDFDQQTDFYQFRQIVQNYVDITELTPPLSIRFVKKIIIHAPDKSSGHKVQKIQIVFNFISKFVLQGELIPDKKYILQDYL